MSGDPVIAHGFDGCRVEIVPAFATFSPNVDDIALSQDFDMFENTSAANIIKQFDQLAGLLRARRQGFDD